MTVKPIRRKEMDLTRKDIPSNDEPAPPMPQEPTIPDHTHPEYDQALVKLQELEAEINGNSMGGVNQEAMDGEKKNGKIGAGKDAEETDQHPDMKESLREAIRKIIKEELTGEPEKDMKKKLEKPNTDNSAPANQIPQTKQPPVGDAPSGGGFDSDDKTNKDDGDDIIKKTPKPAKEYPKNPIQKNKLILAKRYIERAKKLMREANDEDPTTPQPGETEKKPKKMDNQVPNKSPMGGTEQINGNGEEDDKKDKDNDVMKEIYGRLQKEIKRESVSGRKSLVGMSSISNEKFMRKHQEAMSNKQKVDNAVKEYLSKAGYSGALRNMSPAMN